MPDMRESINLERRTERVFWTFLTDLNMKVPIFINFKGNLSITKSMVLEHTYGLIRESIRVNGREIKCMEKDRFLGQMGENILE